MTIGKSKAKIDKEKMRSNKLFRETMELNSQFKEIYGNLVMKN